MNKEVRKLKNEDKSLYGTMIYDYKHNSVGILIKTWDNTFCKNGGGTVDIKQAVCVDYNGKRYDVNFDEITPLETMDEEELTRLGLN